MVEIIFVNAKMSRENVATFSCAPVPTAEQKRTGKSGKRKTSPWISFQPDFREKKMIEYMNA